MRSFSHDQLFHGQRRCASQATGAQALDTTRGSHDTSCSVARAPVTFRSQAMTVSYENSKIIFDGIKAAGIRSLSALPETWLGLLLQRAEDDPEIQLVQVAKEEEAIGIAARSRIRRNPSGS